MHKPFRVSLLQALAVVQLFSTAVFTIAALVSLPAALSTGEMASGLVRPVFGAGVVLVVFLALQRWIPRPELVAPVAATIWWLAALETASAHWGQPPPPIVRSLLFDGVPPGVARVALLVTKLGLLAVFLWLVVSLFRHAPTRAYLTGVSMKSEPTKAA